MNWLYQKIICVYTWAISYACLIEAYDDPLTKELTIDSTQMVHVLSRKKKLASMISKLTA